MKQSNNHPPEAVILPFKKIDDGKSRKMRLERAMREIHNERGASEGGGARILTLPPEARTNVKGNIASVLSDNHNQITVGLMAAFVTIGGYVSYVGLNPPEDYPSYAVEPVDQMIDPQLQSHSSKTRAEIGKLDQPIHDAMSQNYASQSMEKGSSIVATVEK